MVTKLPQSRSIPKDLSWLDDPVIRTDGTTAFNTYRECLRTIFREYLQNNTETPDAITQTGCITHIDTYFTQKGIPFPFANFPTTPREWYKHTATGTFAKLLDKLGILSLGEKIEGVHENVQGRVAQLLGAQIADKRKKGML